MEWLPVPQCDASKRCPACLTLNDAESRECTKCGAKPRDDESWRVRRQPLAEQLRAI